VPEVAPVRTASQEALPGGGNVSVAILNSPRVRYAAAALTGILLALCFPNYNLKFLVWVAPLPLLLAVIHEPRLARAYRLGALAGVLFLALSVYWFDFVMENYGHVPRPAAMAVMVLFFIVDSSYWGVFALTAAWIARRSPRLALMVAPFMWVTMELAETYGYFGGFPWNLVGYALPAEGLRQVASVTGVYGLSFLPWGACTLAAGAVIAEPQFRRRAAVVLVLWLAGIALYNYHLRPPAPTQGHEVAVLVQPNIPLNEAADNWAPTVNPAPLQGLERLTLSKLQQTPREADRAGAPLLVWSENSAPFFFGRDPVFRTDMESLARQAQAYLIFGTVNFVGGDTSRPLNSADVLDPAGNLVLQYDKIHLVPFGEYVPSWLDHFVGKITSEAGNFVPGSNYAPAATKQGEVGLSICYEEIFPQLVRRLTPSGSSVLVNISDDGWYGDSSARYQSQEMAQLRAIENHRYVLRATNDGVTAVIDPYGRVLESLPAHLQAALGVHFDYLSVETPYHQLGDLFAGLCLAVTGLTVAARVRASGKTVGRKQ
jgi:apolipoprotein N-acyltransferase